MVTDNYDHIWDCCCDHGLLGAALLKRHAAPKIHFVDVVPELMSQLEIKLARFFPENSTSNSNSQWQLHCIDVADLPINRFNGKHLVIIAGVGGDLMAELIQAIHQKHSSAEMDFLLCPVHHQYTLRQQLIQLDLYLQDEILLMENQRFYEVLRVSSTKSNVSSKISPVGSLLWQCGTDEQLKNATEYLSKTIAHYKRMQLQSGSRVQNIIDAYSALVP